MTPEELQVQIDELKKQIEGLQIEMRAFENPAEIDPQKVKAVTDTFISDSSEAVTSYDKDVDESGSGSYTVPKIMDGLKELPDGTLIPYYDPV